MIVCKTTKAIKKYLKDCRKKDVKISFVATMGGLHSGHIKLIDKAKSLSDIVVVSVFVNPTQFLANEDFDTYHRDYEADQKILAKHKVDALFLPTIAEVYQNEIKSEYKIGRLEHILCGKSRPGHFKGVVRVLKIMFDILKPDIAIFGEKDYQQLTIIKKFVKDENINVKIVSVKTKREKNGLAISTRNKYLDAEKMLLAPKFYLVMKKAKADYQNGVKLDTIINKAKKSLNVYFDCEYFAILDAHNLEKISNKTINVIILSAVKLGKNRLIDNIVFRGS